MFTLSSVLKHVDVSVKITIKTFVGHVNVERSFSASIFLLVNQCILVKRPETHPDLWDGGSRHFAPTSEKVERGCTMSSMCVTQLAFQMLFFVFDNLAKFFLSFIKGKKPQSLITYKKK